MKYIAVLVAATLVACSPVAPEREVPGIYVARFPFGIDRLELRSDGTFVQKVTVNGNPPVFNDGRWKFDRTNGGILFDRRLWIEDGFGNLNPDWRTPEEALTGPQDVEIWWGRITIGSGWPHPYVKE